MVAGCAAPAILFIGGLPGVGDSGWLGMAAPCAVMSATGFFVLPAMQVLIMEDFKHMSGFAAGMSKLIMTSVSTGGSMAVSYLYSNADVHLDPTNTGAAVDCGGASGPPPPILPMAAANGTATGRHSTEAGAGAGQCVPGAAGSTVLGASPPRFLLWCLCFFMVCTQLCYWQHHWAERRRRGRLSALHQEEGSSEQGRR